MQNQKDRWVLQRTAPYTRTDGTKTQIKLWQSQCVKCSAPIFCKTPMDESTSRAFGLKHCNEHKAVR